MNAYRIFKQDDQQGAASKEPRRTLCGTLRIRGFENDVAARFNTLRLSHMRWDPQPRLSQIPPAGSRNYHIAHKPDLPPDRNNYGSNETGPAVRSLAG